MKKGLFALAFLVISNAASAQVVTDYAISHYLASAPDGAPLAAPYTFPRNSPALLCNQPRIAAPTTTVVNPRYYTWDDPDNPTADCVFDKTLATTPLFADPPPGGDYVARIVAISRVGTALLNSALSVPSNPFVRGTIPPVVLRLRIRG